MHRCCAALALSGLLLVPALFAGERDDPQRERREHQIPETGADAFTPPRMPMEPDDECETIEARARDWLRRHGGETGPIDPEQLRRAVKEEYEKELIRRRQLAAPLSIAGTTWSSIGPTNVAGRVVSIAPHPTTAGLVYVGSATGGVWKTTDSGATWSALTEGLADLSVDAIAVAPSSPNTFYLGTGEPVGSGIPGIGFLSSPDGGSTWNFPGSGVLSTAFWKLSVHPTNALDVLAGTAVADFVRRMQEPTGRRGPSRRERHRISLTSSEILPTRARCTPPPTGVRARPKS